METAASDAEVVVYYTATIAVHVDLVSGTISRVVELREEIHAAADEPVLMTVEGLRKCEPSMAARAVEIAETEPWPGDWEFGY